MLILYVRLLHVRSNQCFLHLELQILLQDRSCYKITYVLAQRSSTDEAGPVSATSRRFSEMTRAISEAIYFDTQRLIINGFVFPCVQSLYSQELLVL